MNHGSLPGTDGAGRWRARRADYGVPEDVLTILRRVGALGKARVGSTKSVMLSTAVSYKNSRHDINV